MLLAIKLKPKNTKKVSKGMLDKLKKSMKRN